MISELEYNFKFENDEIKVETKCVWTFAKTVNLLNEEQSFH